MNHYVGIDVGTSGIRACAIDGSGTVVGEARIDASTSSLGEGVDATRWRADVDAALEALAATIGGLGQVAGLAVDGTSGSMVITGDDGEPVTPGLLYDTNSFAPEAQRITARAPDGAIVQGEASALARALRLQSLAGEDGLHLRHQADFVAEAYIDRTTRLPFSDESNALKTGYDAENRRWPDWIEHCGFDRRFLPDVLPVAGVVAPFAGERARAFGLPSAGRLIAGATDSVAAFLASGAQDVGTAVTSLGTTLALKVLAPGPVNDAARGVYSHRIGDRWLPGGASNVGGGSLLAHFAQDELDAVARKIDPNWEPRRLDCYPLSGIGERFPRHDPTMRPVLAPRGDDARFLFEIMHAIARIEREGYEALASLGAPYPSRVLTAGGGGRSAVWTAIRERVLGVPVSVMENADAAYGMALTARRGVRAAEGAAAG